MKAKETDEKKAQRLEEIIADFKETGVIPPLSRRLKNHIYVEESYGYFGRYELQIGATFSRTFDDREEAKNGERSAVELLKTKYIHERGPWMQAYYVASPTDEGSSIIRVDFHSPEFMGYKSQEHWRYKPVVPARYRQYLIAITLLSTEKIAKNGSLFLELQKRYKAEKTEEKLRAVARKAIAVKREPLPHPFKRKKI